MVAANPDCKGYWLVGGSGAVYSCLEEIAWCVDLLIYSTKFSGLVLFDEPDT